MIRILMVCLGNICRSPLAQGILESKLPSHKFYVDSVGTAAYHIGKAPDHRSIKVAKDNKIDIIGQSARQFKIEDFKTFDIIYAMDSSNYRNIIKLAKTPGDISKVKLILDENPELEVKNVPDPYYGDSSGFDHVFELLNSTCDVIALRLKATP